MTEPERLALRVLLEFGADPMLQDKEGRTVLEFAAEKCREPEVLGEAIDRK